MSKHIKDYSQTGNVLTFQPNGEFYFVKGIKAFQRSDFSLAKKYLSRAWQLEPNEPIIACQYAIALTEMEDYEESNRVLYKIISKLDPNMYECYYFLANNYAYMGIYKEAATHAKLYLKNDPDGEFAQDTIELLEVITLEYEDTDHWLQNEQMHQEEEIIDKQEKAKHLMSEGNFNEAIPLLNEMIQEFPEFWPAYNNLALAYYYQGQKEEAVSIIEKVLKNNPGNLHALCNLTVFYYYEGNNIHNAINDLKKVHPISFDHRYKLGVTFCIIGEYNEGFKWLKTLLKNNYSLDASFYYWFAAAAHHIGKKELAKRSWEQLVKLDPDKMGKEPWEGN